MITGILFSEQPLPVIEESEARTPAKLKDLLNNSSRWLLDGEVTKAVLELESALVEFPDHADDVELALAQALRVQGGVAVGRKDFVEAGKAYSRAAALEPGNPNHWIELGNTYREHGRLRQPGHPNEAKGLLNQAEEAYQKALTASPNDPAALLGLALVNSFQNDRNAAVNRYKEVVKAAPDSPEAVVARRNLKRLTGQEI
jgi:tetratricopeptide (TPR) repeat protein